MKPQFPQVEMEECHKPLALLWVDTHCGGGAWLVPSPWWAPSQCDPPQTPASPPGDSVCHQDRNISKATPCPLPGILSRRVVPVAWRLERGVLGELGLSPTREPGSHSGGLWSSHQRTGSHRDGSIKIKWASVLGPVLSLYPQHPISQAPSRPFYR